MTTRPVTLLGLVLALGVTTPLAAQAPTPPRQAQMPWWQRAVEGRVGHYWIKTDLPAEEAKSLATHLNVMYDEYSRRLASLPARAPTPMNVLIFAREFDYIDTLEYRFGIDAAGTGGMFFVNRNGASLAFFTEGLPRRRVEHVVQHEGFHQFAYSRFGGDLPLWVNEGLAEFFGESIVVGRKVIIGQSNARVVGAVKDMIEAEGYTPFRRMLRMTDERWSEALKGGHAAGLYHQAWSMVHFLVYGDNGRYVARFEAYLKLINAGYPSERAFVQAFETNDIEAFERRWRQYAQAAEPSGFATALERIEFLAAGARELSKRGVVPVTIEDFAEQLAAAGFVHTRSGHGLDVRMTADVAMFEIPWTGNEKLEQRPAFTVDKPRHPASARERHLEKTLPTPPALGTEFLSPHNLSVVWTRDLERNVFRYEIEVR